MDQEKFSFKEFENVRIKATYSMEINGQTIEPGETIATFDKIQIAGLDEVTRRVSAHGGYGDRSWVFWDTAKEQQLTFAQGVFSATQFALLNNARMFEVGAAQPITITAQEQHESNDSGIITLDHTPVENIFLYNASTGEKITSFTQNENQLTIETPYLDVIVNYIYNYSNTTKIIKLGQRWFNGFVSFEGQTKIKDDLTGQVTTGLIKIPRLKLMSDLSIRLGAQATPMVVRFQAIAVPVGSRGNSYISEFYILSDDITSAL